MYELEAHFNGIDPVVVPVDDLESVELGVEFLQTPQTTAIDLIDAANQRLLGYFIKIGHENYLVLVS